GSGAAAGAEAASAAGPRAGWNRETVGRIRIDVPAAWKSESDELSRSVGQRQWNTGERPWPDAVFGVDRDSSGRILSQLKVMLTETIQVAGRAATLRVGEPSEKRAGFPESRILVVVLDTPLDDGRELWFMARSSQAKFAAHEVTFRAILDTVRIVAPEPLTGDGRPAAATIHSYDGDTPADVIEG